MALKSVRFEVFGKVQGVFFRKCTVEKAKSCGIVGWVQNTSRGTVIGVAQGEQTVVETMKHWLATTGSPKSKIDNCNFTEEKSIQKLEYKDFSVRKDPHPHSS
ncbi:hypothetical protein EMCRGX_G026705 [Ephydatia muelleri]